MFGPKEKPPNGRSGDWWIGSNECADLGCCPPTSWPARSLSLRSRKCMEVLTRVSFFGSAVFLGPKSCISVYDSSNSHHQDCYMFSREFFKPLFATGILAGTI